MVPESVERILELSQERADQVLELEAARMNEKLAKFKVETRCWSWVIVGVTVASSFGFAVYAAALFCR